MNIIPAIDIINGQLVRLYQGDYNNKTVYSKSPAEMAYYYASIGLKHIHVVDLNGATDGSLTNIEIIRAILNVKDITIQVGGGIRSVSHAKTLFEAGVSQIILGSLLTENFSLASSIINQFPNQVIAGIDIKNDAIATHGCLCD